MARVRSHCCAAACSRLVVLRPISISCTLHIANPHVERRARRCRRRPASGLPCFLFVCVHLPQSQSRDSISRRARTCQAPHRRHPHIPFCFCAAYFYGCGGHAPRRLRRSRRCLCLHPASGARGRRKYIYSRSRGPTGAEGGTEGSLASGKCLRPETDHGPHRTVVHHRDFRIFI